MSNEHPRIHMNSSEFHKRCSWQVRFWTIAFTFLIYYCVLLFLLTSSNTAPGNLLVFNKHGLGWDVNVHGTLMMLRCPLGLGWGGVGMNMYIYIYVCVHVCLCQVTHTHIYIYGYINIRIYTCIYVYKNQCTCPSMQGMCLCLVYHVCNTILTYCWLPSVFFADLHMDL